VHESPHLALVNAAYFNLIDQVIGMNPTIGVFLLTDSSHVVDELQARYGEKLLYTSAVRTGTEVGVHLSGGDGVALGEEVLLDALLALKCNYFIGNRESNVSVGIAALRAWPKGFLFMLGAKDIRSENFFLHKREVVKKIACRLCGSPAGQVFSREVLSRHIVGYFRCETCGSLQPETPYWLEEAYSLNAEALDGAASAKSMLHFLTFRRLLEILDVKTFDRCVDYCGGTGLFARLMRDLGYNYSTFDRNGGGELCAAARWYDFDRQAKLVTIFDGIEKFTDPRHEWQTIFSAEPDFVVGTATLYGGEDAAWPQLAAEVGQRVFFHTANALSEVASRHGRWAYQVGQYFIMSRVPLSERQGAELIAWNRSLGEVCHDTLQTFLRQPFACAAGDNQRSLARARLRNAGIRIAVDGFYFRFATGISRLWKSLLAEWSANGFSEFVVIIDRAKTAPRLAGFQYVDAPQHDYNNLQADRTMLQEICDREQISLFISTYYTTPLSTPAVQMVLDMIPEVMQFDLDDPQWREKHHAINYAGRYFAISNSTSKDLRGFFPEITAQQVVTAYCGTDFRTPAQENVDAFKKKYGIDRPYFLISGVKSGYKNALLFFRAFAQLGKKRGGYAIVCTNSPPVLEAEFQECVGDGKVHLLVLSDSELQCAYAGALALAYPSRYEGFGLPVLEAMACSCPVITCNNSSIGEVAGDAALYVDPDDVAAMKKALLSVQDLPKRGDLTGKGVQRAARFNWRTMADQVERALSEWAHEIRPGCGSRHGGC
jgi:glycosyltransferase involved in cell wall biosynthesis